MLVLVLALCLVIIAPASPGKYYMLSVSAIIYTSKIVKRDELRIFVFDDDCLHDRFNTFNFNFNFDDVDLRAPKS